MELSNLLQQLQAAPQTENQPLRQGLVDAVNQLIQHDFSRLLQLLYSVDVSEQKLKKGLQNNPQTAAAELITDLIFSRLKEKAASRRQITSPPKQSDEERW